MANLICPKCGGSEYFMSTRSVMKGVGGIWGNRGGLKAFPVCRVCDEIMSGVSNGKLGGRRKVAISKRTKILFGLYLVSVLSSAILPASLFSGHFILNFGLFLGGVISFFVDRKKAPSF